MYNHCDPADHQLPLPLALRQLPAFSIQAGNLKTLRAGIPTARHFPIRIELQTDSQHLAKFFEGNWPSYSSGETPQARIIALKDPARCYGFPDSFDGSRWYCPESKQVWMFGREYYGNLKITVRGLCSELAPPEEMFLHGCALSVNNSGLVLSGMSGAGKTTLTAALHQIFGPDLKLVNDDWGPLSLSTGILRFTEEPNLHMKYPSVRKLMPSLTIDPDTFPSENYSGNPEDAHARLLISPETVFGKEALLREAPLRLFVLVTRDHTKPALVRNLSASDLSFIEGGQFSEFYQRTEWFLNGSLFLTDEGRKERTRQQYRVLLRKYNCILVNNSETPRIGADLVISALRSL